MGETNHVLIAGVSICGQQSEQTERLATRVSVHLS